jgi:mannitol/fructose-specific phosphotransferase system IIA component (Ntr-type)
MVESEESLFKNTLRSAGVFVRLTSKIWDEAMLDMLNALADAGKLGTASVDKILSNLVKRQEEGTTAYGHGVAVPPGRHRDLPGLVAAIGLLEEGIDFKALDRCPVDLIVLVLSRPDQREEMMQLQDSVLSYLKRERFRESIRKAESLDEALAIMEEVD